MKISMNEATALNCQAMSIEQDIILAEKYGYDMIEPRTMDRMRDYLANHSIEELAEFFQAHNIAPLAFNTLCFFNNRSPEGWQGILDELKQMCEWGQKIGCKTVITVPTVSLNKVTRGEIHKSAIACLKEMGKLAGEYGMRVSVEFIGHPAASINTFSSRRHGQRRHYAGLFPLPRHGLENQRLGASGRQKDFHCAPQRH